MATKVEKQVTILNDTSVPISISVQITAFQLAQSKSYGDNTDSEENKSNEIDTATPVIIDKAATIENIRDKMGRSKTVSSWDFFASDKTHLRETLHYKYILQWIIGICCALLILFIVEYVLFHLLNIHFCDMKNNDDYANWGIHKLHFLSRENYLYSFQQIVGIGICYAGYWIYHCAEIVGLDVEKWWKWRMSLAIISWTILFCSLIFIIPIKATYFQSIVPLSMLIILIFGFVANGMEGVRRIILWPVIVAIFSVVNYIFSSFVFSRLSHSVFAVLYPFYLTTFETLIFRLISIIDIPNCCRCNRIQLNTDNSSNELGAIYFWPDRDIYVLCASINIFTESYRMASLIFLKNDYINLTLTFILSIISEIFTRNNLYYEIIYRIIYRQSAPPLNRVYSIYLTCKLHTEYIPIFIIIMYNLLHFGYTADCYLGRIATNMDISNTYWFIIILFMLEIMCDICGHWSNKCFVKVVKIFDKTDEARRAKYVKLNFVDIIMASTSFAWVSIQAFILDGNSRELT